MPGRYAYSFDRQTFTGQFDSRGDALRAAITKASQLSEQPTEVYVGAKIPGHSQADGHAQEVLERMAERARAATDAADRYLQSVSEQAEAELDSMLERAITDWLGKHNLLPTYYTVAAISEHPVPAAAAKASTSTQTEVNDIGTTDFPLGR